MTGSPIVLSTSHFFAMQLFAKSCQPGEKVECAVESAPVTPISTDFQSSKRHMLARESSYARFCDRVEERPNSGWRELDSQTSRRFAILRGDSVRLSPPLYSAIAWRTLCSAANPLRLRFPLRFRNAAERAVSIASFPSSPLPSTPARQF